jgi:Fe-S cluster assembly scaffold protein SufB
MSRGLKREDARKELIAGFFEDAIDKAPAGAQELVRERVLGLID